MSLRHYEDLSVGESIDLGCRTAAGDEALEFAREFDPQPFHLDCRAAGSSLMGGLIASGWYTAAMLSRMLWDNWFRFVKGAGSLGVTKHVWIRPLYVGDTMYGKCTIKAMQESRTMPGVGLVDLELKATSSANRIICAARWTVMVHKRAGSKPSFENMRRPFGAQNCIDRQSLTDAGALGREMLYLNLCKMNRTLLLGEVSASTEQMIRFSRSYNPQPFLIDEKLAEESHFGRLVASGWHSCALVMRAYVDSRLRALDSLPEAERSYAVDSGGIGVGIEALRWISPVHANEKLAACITPLERRPGRMRQGWGKLRMRAELLNGKGQPTLQFYPTVYMRESPEVGERPT